MIESLKMPENNDSDMIMDVIEQYKGKYDVRIVETGYEFQKHANRLLIIKRG